MKKITFTTILSFIYLAISSITAYVLKYACNDTWVSLGTGVGILLLSAVLACFGRKDQKEVKNPNLAVNIICYLLSGVALGFCIRAWHIFRGFDNSIWILLLASFLAVWLLWIYYALSKLPIFENHPVILMILFIVLSLAAYIVVVINTKTTFISTVGFYLIIELAFIFAMLADADNYSEFIRNITLSTYSVFVVAIIIAIILLAGEGADLDFDFSIDGIDLPSGKKNNKADDRLIM